MLRMGGFRDFFSYVSDYIKGYDRHFVEDDTDHLYIDFNVSGPTDLDTDYDIEEMLRDVASKKTDDGRPIVDGIGLVDFNNVNTGKETLKIVDRLKDEGVLHQDFVLLPGVELMCKGGKHTHVFGASKEILKELGGYETIAKTDVSEIEKQLRENGLIVVRPHSYTPHVGTTEKTRYAHAIETVNGYGTQLLDILDTERLQEYNYFSSLMGAKAFTEYINYRAEKHTPAGKYTTGGSNAHTAVEVGRIVTAIPKGYDLLNPMELKQALSNADAGYNSRWFNFVEQYDVEGEKNPYREELAKVYCDTVLAGIEKELEHRPTQLFLARNVVPLVGRSMDVMRNNSSIIGGGYEAIKGSFQYVGRKMGSAYRWVREKLPWGHSDDGDNGDDGNNDDRPPNDEGYYYNLEAVEQNFDLYV